MLTNLVLFTFSVSYTVEFFLVEKGCIWHWEIQYFSSMSTKKDALEKDVRQPTELRFSLLFLYQNCSFLSQILMKSAVHNRLSWPALRDYPKVEREQKNISSENSIRFPYLLEVRRLVSKLSCNWKKMSRLA